MTSQKNTSIFDFNEVLFSPGLCVCLSVCLSVYLCVRLIFWYFISRLLERDMDLKIYTGYLYCCTQFTKIN